MTKFVEKVIERHFLNLIREHRYARSVHQSSRYETVFASQVLRLRFSEDRGTVTLFVSSVEPTTNWYGLGVILAYLDRPQDDFVRDYDRLAAGLASRSNEIAQMLSPAGVVERREMEQWADALATKVMDEMVARERERLANRRPWWKFW